jgi:type IV secretory pathway VirB10-like protein
MTPERSTYAAKRRGGTEFRFSFSWEDATKAGLTGRATYKADPAEMLRHRARSKCVRAVFPDVVAGLYSRDEADDIVDVTPRQVVAEVVHAAAETATQPALPAATKVRKRALAAQVEQPAVIAQPATVAEQQGDETQDEAARRQRLDEAERLEYEEVEADRRAALLARPHRNEGGDVIDPLTGEVHEGYEAQAFASDGDSMTEEALTAAQKTVSDAKAMLSPSRYQSLAWTYFWARKAVRGADAPAQYQQLRAI